MAQWKHKVIGKIRQYFMNGDLMDKLKKIIIITIEKKTNSVWHLLSNFILLYKKSLLVFSEILKEILLNEDLHTLG